MKINNDIVNALKNSNKVAIFIHTNPDGDCLGSASALKQALVSLNKQADIFSDSIVPENYMFISGMDSVRYDEDVNDYDLHVAVDCPDVKRVGKYSIHFNKIENTVCIDHHKSREPFARLSHTKEDSSSAAIMVYHYIKQITTLTKDMAIALYSGIAGDTGCFMHSNTTSDEHRLAAELIEFGFDLDMVNQRLFKYTTLAKFELTKRAYMGAEFFANGKVGLFKLTAKDINETGADLNDTTGMVNQITNVNGCEVGVMLYEKENGLFRCSLRSSGKVDVSVIAEQFGGGGHIFASGCNIFGCLNTAKNKIVNACVKELRKIGLL